MKLNKTFGRVATTLVATAMLASLAAPAMAASVTGDGETAVSSFTITKHLTKEEKTMTPNVSFTFSVAPVSDEAVGDETRNGVPVSGGAEGGVTVNTSDDSADFTPGTELDKSTDLTDTVMFDVNLAAFKGKTGIYKYTITEDTVDYDGITKDNNVLNLYVYIQNDNNGGVKVAYTELVDPDGGEGSTAEKPVEAKIDSFTNDYDSINKTALHDLTVYKVLTGNAASMNDTFQFTVKVDGESGEKYYVEFGTYAVPEDAEEGASPVFVADPGKTPIVLTSGTESAVFALGNNDAFKVYGLDSDDQYTVTEKTANQNGYTVKIDGTSDPDGVTDGTTAADKVVKFDNYKNASTPTGIVMNVAPYALLVVVAAAGCFVFMRKRRED